MFLLLVWILLFIPCGICCCCFAKARRKRHLQNTQVGYNQYAVGGRQVTVVKNAHSTNPVYGSPVYQMNRQSSFTTGVDTFTSYVPSYREAPGVNNNIGYTKTTFTVYPTDSNQPKVVQTGPPVTGRSYSTSSIGGSNTMGHRVSSGDLPSVTTNKVESSFTAVPNPRDSVVITTTTTEEKTEEHHETSTEWRKSSIKK